MSNLSEWWAGPRARLGAPKRDRADADAGRGSPHKRAQGAAAMSDVAPEIFVIPPEALQNYQRHMRWVEDLVWALYNVGNSGTDAEPVWEVIKAAPFYYGSGARRGRVPSETYDLMRGLHDSMGWVHFQVFLMSIPSNSIIERKKLEAM